MTRGAVYAGLRAHVRRFFKGHRRTEYPFAKGPPGRNPPDFRVVRAAPGPRTPRTTYLSLGSWESAGDGCGAEFVAVTGRPEMRCVELLAMVSYYHRTQGLGVGHTFPLGHRWLGGTCDHFLVSLPYPFGRDLEDCRPAEGRHVRFLWLLPVTLAEKEFRHAHGLEALERRFQDAGLDTANPHRASVV